MLTKEDIGVMAGLYPDPNTGEFRSHDGAVGDTPAATLTWNTLLLGVHVSDKKIQEYNPVRWYFDKKGGIDPTKTYAEEEGEVTFLDDSERAVAGFDSNSAEEYSTAVISSDVDIPAGYSDMANAEALCCQVPDGQGGWELREERDQRVNADKYVTVKHTEGELTVKSTAALLEKLLIAFTAMSARNLSKIVVKFGSDLTITRNNLDKAIDDVTVALGMV